MEICDYGISSINWTAKHDPTDTRKPGHMPWDNTIRIWHSSTGECIKILKGHTAMVLSIAISKDDTKIYSCSSDKTIKIWLTSTGECIRVLRGSHLAVTAITISNDNRTIISG